jgi:hypothetical protein
MEERKGEGRGGGRGGRGILGVASRSWGQGAFPLSPRYYIRLLVVLDIGLDKCGVQAFYANRRKRRIGGGWGGGEGGRGGSTFTLSVVACGS